ncbi:isopenicillin N synthase family dioxygenase [Pseudonocardia sp.]|uniref:isopenicillin N synthase family dioxygenase n=1 Tax=Pseudonocardia sp. TaxID=60912 RepID=UPI003D13EA2A
MAEFAVPLIDIGPYVRGGGDRAAVAAAMDAACRDVGFVQVVGHGVPDDAAAGLAAAIDAYFGEPAEVKAAHRAPPGINRGYTPPRSESVSLSLGVGTRMPDFFEAFNVGAAAAEHPGLDLPADVYPDNIWPDVPGFEVAVRRWFAEARRVAHTLTDVFADALGLPAGFFAAYTDHSIDVLRMNNYALPPGRVADGTDLTGMGEHTDYGIVTVLWADDAPGLQVLGQDGRWHDVAPAPGALLVNLGDLTARWTNERWLSTLHRVKPPVVDGTVRRRRSAAFFHDGNVEAVVEALPSCVPPGRAPIHPPTTIGEHIEAKLAGSRAGIANTAATRDAERVRAAAGPAARETTWPGTGVGP